MTLLLAILAAPLVWAAEPVSPPNYAAAFLGPTWVKGRYASFSLVPGVVWAFSPYAYAAARFVVPVDPERKLVLFPGLGLSRTFGRTTPILEVNLSSTVGKGKPDFGIAVTAGVLVGF